MKTPKMNTRRIKPSLSIGLLAFAACTSFELPPDAELPSIESCRDEASRIDVAVAPTRDLNGPEGSGRSDQYQAWLITALQESGLFHRVGSSSEIQNPTLVAAIEAEPTGGCYLPYVSPGLIGIVPAAVHEQRGYAFSLGPVADPGARVTFDCRYEQTAWCGWLTGMRNMFPAYTSDVPEDEARFRKFVAVALRRRLAQVVSLGAAASELTAASETPGTR